MTSGAVRVAGVVAIAGFVLFAGWRVAGSMQAERHAAKSPAHALRWRAEDPAALLALAESHLRKGDLGAAETTARRLLAREPLHGEGFRVLAGVAERRGDKARATALHETAVRRAPRDLPSRAWLAQRYLQSGRYADAIAQIDRILRMTPQRGADIHPLLVKLAKDPGFARALAQALRESPPWRKGLLAALQHPRDGDPVAAGQVMQALEAQGGLADAEVAMWLDSLIAQGRWGEAHARWAGRAVIEGGRLPLLYNGEFERSPTNAGFDWRIRRVPGVLLRFEQAAGARGNAAYFRFLNRRVPSAGLEQALVLQPGRYRMQMRMRAQSLRSELGLQWRLICTGSGALAGSGTPVEGSFGWRPAEFDIVIPAQGCPAQWLRLVNPVTGGSAQRVAGELWVDDMAVTRVSP